jgi:hypothetical protein
MSHYTQIETGKYIMTEVNALRHFIRLANHALKLDNVELMRQVYSDSTYHINIDYCYKCPYDDLGYCYLRGKNSIPDNEKFKICFTNWIKCMQNELNSLLKRKGKLK